MSNIMNKENLGQFFTPSYICDKMINLIENKGIILEPSCGDGAFLKKLPKTAIGLEIDEKIKYPTALTLDFFEWNKKVDTIIGNPPYVKYKDILDSTKAKLPQVMDARTNLYSFFIWHAIEILNDNGELIFIVPRDLIKSSSTIPLMKKMYLEGGFTYWQEYGDEKIFENASPNVVIFRWVKGASHKIFVKRKGDYLIFEEIKNNLIPLGEIFTVLVGGASGANKIFIEESGNINLVVSDTKKTGKTKKAHYYEEPNEYLKAHKEALLSRKIKKFTEKNWWEWGRKIRHISGEKIYVNSKTRDMAPFFTNDSGWFDGSILALIPKETIDIDKAIKTLNDTDWSAQGFLVGGRLIFGQRTLSNALISDFR